MSNKIFQIFNFRSFISFCKLTYIRLKQSVYNLLFFLNKLTINKIPIKDFNFHKIIYKYQLKDKISFYLSNNFSKKLAKIILILQICLLLHYKRVQR